MSFKLLTEHNLDFLSPKGGCRGSSESSRVKMPHCWKSHALAHFPFNNLPQKRKGNGSHKLKTYAIVSLRVNYIACVYSPGN